MSIFRLGGATSSAGGGGALGLGGVEKEYVDSRDSLRVLKSGDTMGGDLNMAGHRIIGAADPTDPQDATTASFVLDAATQLKAGVVSRDGTPSATMQADLDLDGNGLVRVRDPTNPQDAATKKYADTRDKLRVLKAGDTMTGALTVDTSSAPGRDSIVANTGIASIALENCGISVESGNLAVDRPAGGPDLDILQASDLPGGGIRIRKDDDTAFYQLGWNSSGRLELRYTGFDSSAVTSNTVCEFSAAGIRSLVDPIAPQDAATKNYVDGRSPTYLIVWAEENNTVNSGEYEWSFGNGSEGSVHGRIGYVMMAPGRVVRMGLSTAADSGGGALGCYPSEFGS